MVSCGSIIFLLFHHILLTLCVGFVIILSFLKILYSARLIMQYYIFILIALVLLSLQLTANKEYGILCGNSTKSSMIFSTCTGFASGIIPLVYAAISHEKITATPYSLFMAFLIGVFCCTYMSIGLKVMGLGSLSVFTMFLMLGGMLLPYLFGVIWLKEPVSAARIIGVILLAASLVFPVMARKESGKSGALFLILCLSVFLLNGGIGIVSKLHQVSETYAKSGTASFSFLSNAANGTLSGILLIITLIKEKKKGAETETESHSPAKKVKILPVVVVLAAYALCNGISYTLQLLSAGKVPASVMYPMMTGGSVVLTAVAGLVFFHEKPDKISLIGLILSFAATFLFLF